MRITELPPFNPRLDDFRAEEFLRHTLSLLEFPLEQDQDMLDTAPFQLKEPPPAPEPPIPLLPSIWYPRATQEVTRYVQVWLTPPRNSYLFLETGDVIERAIRPLLAGQGPVTVRGEAGIGKTALLAYIAHHARTRQRFRRIWWFDDATRVGQAAAITLERAHVMGEPDPIRQLQLLSRELDDATLIIVDNLYPEHFLLDSILKLSPFVLVGVETPPEIPEEDEYGNPVVPQDPPNTVTLRRWTQNDAVNLLAQTANLHDPHKNAIPRELRPLLDELVMLLDFHPLAVVVAAALVKDDELTIEQLLNSLHAITQESDPEAILHLCLDTMPVEYQRLLEGFGAFSPLGTHTEALQSVVDMPDMGLLRGLTYLKRRRLIRHAERFGDRYIAASLAYRRVTQRDPNAPGSRSGERAREWTLRYAESYTYDEAALFAAEHHLRHLYQMAAKYQKTDLTTRLNRALMHYLRTYMPAFVPHDAPPPRLTGERAKAVQLARHGHELAMRGDFEQGREVLKTAVTAIREHGSEHDRAEAMVMLAQIEDSYGDAAAASRLLEEAAKLVFELNAEESVSVVRLGLAMTYRHQNRLKEALAVLDESWGTNAERARIYRLMGKLDEMVRVLEVDDALTPYAKAESYLQAGQYAEALEAISEDNTPLSHHLRAMIYHFQGEYETAIRGYDMALQSYAPDDPSKARTWRAMASILALQEKYDTAEQTLDSALRNLEKYPDALQRGRTLSLLAAVHLRRGANRAALETATQAVQELADDHETLADAYRTWGRASWRLGRYDEALSAFLQESEHAQSSPRRDEIRIGIALFHIAECYHVLGELDRAVANLRRAMTQIKPEDAPQVYLLTLVALYRALFERERFSDALEVCQKALAFLDKNPPPDLQHLGYMLAQYVRICQTMNMHPAAQRSYARWLTTLAGRADALTDENRPALAVLALSLAARSLLSYKRVDEALPIAEEAMRMAETHFAGHPAAWSARRDYGIALVETKQWQAAHDTLHPLLMAAIQNEPHTYAAVCEGVGLALHHLGEYHTALNHFFTALDAQPIRHKQGLIFEHIAQSYLGIGETTRAVENFNEALKFLDPQNVPGDIARVLTALAHTLAGMNRYGDAIAVYENALKMLTSLPEALPLNTVKVYVSLGHSNRMQGQLREAARAYQDALDILAKHQIHTPSEHREILLHLARTKQALEKYDEAIVAFELARDEANDFGDALEVGNITRELGEAEHTGGYLERSLRTYEDALAYLTPEYPKERAAALRSYGRALAQAMRFDEARAAWNEALAITTDIAPLEIALTHHAIGQAFVAQKVFDNAAEAYRRALKYHPEGTVEAASTYRELGKTLLAANKPPEAIAPLQTSLEIEKKQPQQSNARLIKTLELLGQAEELSGNRLNAIARYHALLVYMDQRFQPQPYAAILRILGRLYAEEKNWENSQKALNESLELELALKPRDDSRIASTLRMIADAYHMEGNLEKAANAYKKMATYANLSTEEANRLRTALSDLEKHRATLTAALDSLAVLRKTNAHPRDFAYVYALIVRTYYLLSDLMESQRAMQKLIELLNTYTDSFNLDDERPEFRTLAHLRLAIQYEQQKDKARARDHYRAAMKTNTDTAMGWLLERGLEAVN
ncbi:MAG: tetratricopeptide repeat protein [Anaerolineae bacterium]|nr:MAG: tetratricopeptide repeat protein [Anaerolineae bacterium]